ncbi:MAG: vitamin B12 dependent methionine synthase, partial [Thermoproteota archaeon]
MTILNNIPIELDSRQILNKLGLEADDKFVDLRKIIQKELEHALSVANPKALYHTAFVNRVADNSVFINGVQFTSNVLRINLEDKTKVFPYIVTVGEELDRLT